MANCSKATRASCNNLFNHYERKENIKFGNQEIDKSKSHLNYNLANNKNLTQNEILNKRLSEVKVLKRKNVNVICSWIITLPKTIKKDSEEEKEFFKKSYEFLKNEYGEKNIISSYVHKDETTPHMHFCFIPIVIDKKKNIEKVSAKELITRNHLQTFHNRLEKYLSNHFKKEIGILNGATENGNKTILEIKNQELKLKNIEIENDIKQISSKIKKYNTTLEKIKNLKIKNTIIGNAVKGITTDEIISIIKEATYSLERKKEINIAINEIKKLLEEKEKLQTENEKLKEELNKNKISLKNRIKEKNLFLRLKNEWEDQNKILEKIPEEILELAKSKVEQKQKINNHELEL